MARPRRGAVPGRGAMGRSRRSLPEHGGVWAWEVLRCREDYRAAWAASAGPAGHEPAPFPVRIQSEADLAAAAWGLSAWEDPAADGPASPFWGVASMLGCVLVEGEPPLVGLLADAKSSLTGLRLIGGDLILQIERGVQAVQLRLTGAAAFPDGGGIGLRHGIPQLPRTVARELDLWCVAGAPAPPRGRVRGAGTVNF